MKFLKIIFTIGLIIGCIYLIKGCYDDITYSNTVEYALNEIDDGVFGYYNTVSSRVPAHNYEMITLCLNGSVRTLKGNVNIHYTNDEPKLIWTQKKYVYGDIFNIYVPRGSIEMCPNVGLK